MMEFNSPPFQTTDGPPKQSLELAQQAAQCSLGPSNQAVGVYFTSYNALVDLQLFFRDTPRGVRAGPVVRGVGPTSTIFPGAVGFTATSHVTGTPALVIAQVWETFDGPLPAQGAPINGTLSAGGVITPFSPGSGIWVVSIQTTDPNGAPLAAANGLAWFRVPSELDGLNLISVASALVTASSAGKPTAQITNFTNGAAAMLSTALSIDVGEIDSSTAAVPAVINPATSTVAEFDHLRVDCTIGGTGAVGLAVELQFQ